MYVCMYDLYVCMIWNTQHTHVYTRTHNIHMYIHAGNLAWRDEETRDRMFSTYGLIGALLSLLWEGEIRGKESALAALSNLTINEKCAVGLIYIYIYIYIFARMNCFVKHVWQSIQAYMVSSV